MESISEIKSKFLSASIQDISALINLYCNDTRKGVQNIICQYQKKIEVYQKEQLRLDTMLTFEKECYQKGLSLIHI